MEQRTREDFLAWTTGAAATRAPSASRTNLGRMRNLLLVPYGPSGNGRRRLAMTPRHTVRHGFCPDRLLKSNTRSTARPLCPNVTMGRSRNRSTTRSKLLIGQRTADRAVRARQPGVLLLGCPHTPPQPP